MMLRPLDTALSEAPSVADDPLAAFRAARADLEAVLDDRSSPTRGYDGMFGRTSVAATVDQFMAFDLVVHGWDLARATGQDETIDPAEVDRILGFVERMGTSTMRENGVTGPEVAVPADAPEQDRMLGCSVATRADHASDGWWRRDERWAARRSRSPRRRPRRTSGVGSSMSAALASRKATASSQKAMTSDARPVASSSSTASRTPCASVAQSPGAGRAVGR